MLKQEDSTRPDSGPMCCTAALPPNVSADETYSEDNKETLNDRLAFRVTNTDVDDETVERHSEDMARKSEISSRRKTKGNAVQIKHRKCSLLDMMTSRSCRHSLCVSLILWTSVLLLFLTKGCASEDRPRFDRYQKYDHDSEVQGYVSPEVQNKYHVIHILRELIQRQQQQQQQQQQQDRANQQQFQMNNNGEDLSENQIDWKNVPLPLLYQIRAIINDGSKEEDKRGSSLSESNTSKTNGGAVGPGSSRPTLIIPPTPSNGWQEAGSHKRNRTSLEAVPHKRLLPSADWLSPISTSQNIYNDLLDDFQEITTEKKKHMSLCHFKICNLG